MQIVIYRFVKSSKNKNTCKTYGKIREWSNSAMLKQIQ